MKNIILIITLIYTSSVFSQNRNIILDTATICQNQERLDLQIKCIQDMTRCLGIDQKNGNIVVGAFTKCVMKLTPRHYYSNKK